jgi:SAM-dependent methyltransferase
MGSGELNPLGRFSDRVADYVRYRPSYPPALLAALQAQAGLGPAAAVADIGSGTGLFTRLLLEVAGRVYGVEPNGPMRAAAEADLGDCPGFCSVPGTAEATGLPDHSVTLVTCAQAFHWFDPVAARREFQRILTPMGHCALIWNTTVVTGDFALGYEEIKDRFGTDFKAIRHEHLTTAGRFESFFGPAGWQRSAFANAQVLDWPGLKGRLLSSSYAPPPGHAGHAPMLAALQALFDRSQAGGVVRMEYTTELFLGRFS